VVKVKIHILDGSTQQAGSCSVPDGKMTVMMMMMMMMGDKGDLKFNVEFESVVIIWKQQ
jgi:hypothetical protein